MLVKVLSGELDVEEDDEEEELSESLSQFREGSASGEEDPSPEELEY